MRSDSCARGSPARRLLEYSTLLMAAAVFGRVVLSLRVLDHNLSKVWGGRTRKEDPGNVNA